MKTRDSRLKTRNLAGPAGGSCGPAGPAARVSSLESRVFFAATLVLLFLSACGPATLGGPCQTTCDCKETTAASKCVGEWVCNGQSTCEYTCKNTCSTGGVYTCSG